MREQLLKLLDALNASTRTLRRDACGDWAIIGRDGHIYSDGSGYLLCVSTNESARRWGFVKKRLAFAELRQDGDDEGCLRLDRLPTAEEAEAIRTALGIRKRREVTDETREQLARARTLLNGPFVAAHPTGRRMSKQLAERRLRRLVQPSARRIEPEYRQECRPVPAASP